MNVRILGSLCLALTAILPMASPSAAATEEPNPPTLVVNGTASVSREPDIAHVALAVETNAEQAAQATQANADIAQRVRAALEKLGIPSKSIVTSYYNLRYNPRPQPTGPPLPLRRPVSAIPIPSGERYGYVVTHTLDVTTKPTQVGTVIDAAIKAGATSVGGVSYDVSDRRAAYLEALREAVADARAQAEAAAAASGAHLGAIERLAVGSAPRGFPTPMAMTRATEAAGAPTEVTPGAVRITAYVSISYKLTP